MRPPPPERGMPAPCLSPLAPYWGCSSYQAGLSKTQIFNFSFTSPSSLESFQSPPTGNPETVLGLRDTAYAADAANPQPRCRSGPAGPGHSPADV